MEQTSRQAELLAPASGLEAVRAAVCAGADAVYTGGSKFGARAYADNMSEEELLEAIDFVHLHGKRLYLTVNTLLKERELSEQLKPYLLPYYRQGLDAVIVQDIGVFRFLKREFPGLPIHVSTQAVVTGKNSAALWEELGAQRIVTARELSLEELHVIRRETSLEIESFVHGALCYCYSGQCLFSSLAGGRSGNRGRCAQPCRLPYTLTDASGKPLSRKKEPYLLSPKDMCTLDILPDLIEAGVYSLKIEGRMKRLEYTAGVTAIYRKYVDLYLQKGRSAYSVSEEDRITLMDLYNRGGFHSGYYEAHNGKEMMSLSRPNHQGVRIGTLSRGKKGYTAKAAAALHEGDIVEFRGVTDQKTKRDLALAVEEEVVQNGAYRVPKKYEYLLEGRKEIELYRTHNEQLLRELNERYMAGPPRIALSAELTLASQEPMRLTLRLAGEPSICVQAEGSVVQEAKQRPLSEEDAARQLKKTKNTPFVIEPVQMHMKGACFVQLGELNDLRRKVLEELRRKLLQPYLRIEPQTVLKECSQEKAIGSGKPELHVLVEQFEQFQLLLQYKQIKRIYLSVHAADLRGSRWQEGIRQLADAAEVCHKAGKQLYLVFPYIWREQTQREYEYRREHPGKSRIELLLEFADGVLAKTMEAFAFLKKQEACRSRRVPVVLDASAYAMNREALACFQSLGAAAVTLPLELNKGELLKLAQNQLLPMELVIYGHMPMMVSAQCVRKNTTGCQKEPRLTRLHDRKNRQHYVRQYCDTCYSVLYNSEPLYLLDKRQEVLQLPLQAVRLQFSVETASETAKVMQQYTAQFENGQAGGVVEKVTRGHWNRGVE